MLQNLNMLVIHVKVTLESDSGSFSIHAYIKKSLEFIAFMGDPSESRRSIWNETFYQFTGTAKVY